MPKAAKKNARQPRLPHVVCKPCWELKYCPYGPLVENFPLIGPGLPLRQVRKSHRSWVEAVRRGVLKTERQIPKARGGPSTVENLRVLCRTCNRRKRDSLKEVLAGNPRI